MMPYTPEGVGHRATDTSYKAGRKIGGKARPLRDQVLEALRNSPVPLGADEIAKRLGKDRLAIRPRLTELRESGLVADSGVRGKTDSGSPCILWELA